MRSATTRTCRSTHGPAYGNWYRNSETVLSTEQLILLERFRRKSEQNAIIWGYSNRRFILLTMPCGSRDHTALPTVHPSARDVDRSLAARAHVQFEEDDLLPGAARKPALDHGDRDRLGPITAALTWDRPFPSTHAAS